MMQSLIVAPLLPLTAGMFILLVAFAGYWQGDDGERWIARLSQTAITLSCLLLIVLWASQSAGANHAQHYGTWLRSGKWTIFLDLNTDAWSLALASLFACLLGVSMRFARYYMHREVGYARFFGLLNLLAAAMLWLVLADDAVLSFIGWELAGACSYGLIAFYHQRDTAVHNATRVFVTNRIGDAGFLLGLALSAVWLHSTAWPTLAQQAQDLQHWDAESLALCFVLAAAAKSAQVPFAPWLTRALEGPTPSSAVFYGGVMVHAGIWLLIKLQPLLQHAPLVSGLMVLIGVSSVLYSYWVGLAQTDVKTVQGLAVIGQLGLMWIECGLGWFELATWHLAAHAIIRLYLLLSAPSIMHVTGMQPVTPVAGWLANWRWGYLAALQRLWLEAASDSILVKPIQRLARDMRFIDDHILDPALGTSAPAFNAIASLAQAQEQKLGANLASAEDRFAQGSGLAGQLTAWVAALSHYFEYHFILRGIGRDAIHAGRLLGHWANRFEDLLLRPRYIMLFVVIVLLVALGDGL